MFGDNTARNDHLTIDLMILVHPPSAQSSYQDKNWYEMEGSCDIVLILKSVEKRLQARQRQQSESRCIDMRIDLDGHFIASGVKGKHILGIIFSTPGTACTAKKNFFFKISHGVLTIITDKLKKQCCLFASCIRQPEKKLPRLSLVMHC